MQINDCVMSDSVELCRVRVNGMKFDILIQMLFF